MGYLPTIDKRYNDNGVWINITKPIHKSCKDRKGRIVENGDMYIPYSSDPCYQCVCDNGEKTQCRTVQCMVPNASCYRVTGECCQFDCYSNPGITGTRKYNGTSHNNILQGGKPTNPNSDPTGANLGLRVIAATVTLCFLVAVALIIFHLSRRRKRMLRARHYHAAGMGLEDLPPGLPSSMYPGEFGMIMDLDDNYNGQFYPLPSPMCSIALSPPPYSPPLPKPPENSDPPPPYTPVDANSNHELVESLDQTPPTLPQPPPSPVQECTSRADLPVPCNSPDHSLEGPDVLDDELDRLEQITAEDRIESTTEV